MTAALTEDRFDGLVGQHRRELHVHCYRMLASYHEAEDAVQETFLRAWRARASFQPGAAARPWLYTIATHVCLDVLRRSSRRAAHAQSYAELPWLEPFPDNLLVATAAEQPDALLVARETIELAFLAALQVLPPRQRAVFIARDVLGWPAADTAAALGTSAAAANSALGRARTTMQAQLGAGRSEWSASAATDEDLVLLQAFIDAHERCDAAAVLAICAQDVRVTMPPYPYLFQGLDALLPLMTRAFGPDRDGEWRLLPTSANRMPAAASYLLRPGDTAYRPFKLDVLRVRHGAVVEITTFGPELFPELNLPATLKRPVGS
jgi:RNA polymerase sigma-70 factor (TIGR02960 family)